MKGILFATAIFYSICLSAQITLNHTYTINDPYFPRHLTKLGLKGYKYYTVNISGGTIEVFNTNNSLYKSITLPSSISFTSTSYNQDYYLSDNLFNNDTLLEYCISLNIGSVNSKFYIFNELGSILFFKDSTWGTNFNTTTPLIVRNSSFIYFDGTSVKMRLATFTSSNSPQDNKKWSVYNLPGILPCSDCSSGVTTGLSIQANEVSGERVAFYPNPVNEDLKLEYKIPVSSKVAKIKVYDLNGRLVEDYRISPSTDHILLPSNYNNGLYLYSLEVDGQIIKTEKIILNR
jgi:hypothetical protein